LSIIYSLKQGSHKTSKPTEAAAQHGGTRRATTTRQRPYSCLQQQRGGPRQGGHPGQDQDQGQGRGRPTGRSTAPGGRGAASTIRPDMGKPKERQAQRQRKDLHYHEIQFLLPEMGVDSSNHITFYYIYVA